MKKQKLVGKGWIGVDLDGTLAYYDGRKGAEHIGDPILRMMKIVKDWVDEGVPVKIFTAFMNLFNQWYSVC